MPAFMLHHRLEAGWVKQTNCLERLLRANDFIGIPVAVKGRQGNRRSTLDLCRKGWILREKPGEHGSKLKAYGWWEPALALSGSQHRY